MKNSKELKESEKYHYGEFTITPLNVDGAECLKIQANNLLLVLPQYSDEIIIQDMDENSVKRFHDGNKAASNNINS